MRHATLPALFALALVASACGPKEPAPAAGQPAASAPSSTVSMRVLATIGDSTSHIEGLAEHAGLLYTADFKDGGVWRIDPAAPTPARVGQLPSKPGEQIFGSVADSAGNLFFAAPARGVIWRIAADRLGAADFSPTKDVTEYVTGAKGANGVTFDRHGHLWISGGDSHVLYHAGPKGGQAQVFARDYSAIETDTTIAVRAFVPNGAAFDSKGFLYTANTGTGEISRIEIKPDYTPGSISSFIKRTDLRGADGLIVDADDNVWVSCNWLNTLARISPAGEVTFVAVSSPMHPGTAVTTVDSGHPHVLGPADVLHFPAELKRIGATVYLANLNFPLGANQGAAPGASIAAVEVR